MDTLRVILYGTLVFLGVLLWQNWEKEHPRAQALQTEQAMANEVVRESDMPAIATTTPKARKVTIDKPRDLITVTTDTLAVKIDPLGGDIIEAKLLKYSKSQQNKEPLLLLNNLDGKKYVAQSRLISEDGPDSVVEPGLYSSVRNNYQLGNNNEIIVPLTWKNSQGLSITKNYYFKRNEYVIHTDYQINNNTNKTFVGQTFYQLKRQPVDEKKRGMFAFNTFTGAAISTDDKPFKKIQFKNMASEPIKEVKKGGWAAMIQHYFLSAWIPEPTNTHTYYSHVYQDDQFIIGMMSPKKVVAPQSEKTLKSKLYLGPELVEQLKHIAPHLELTVDYGILWPISVFLFWIMKFLHEVIGNWGWAIVGVTLCVKAAFYRLSARSFRSMAKLRLVQPKLESIKKRFGEDREKLGKAMMELYKKEKINPLGGCLPILVQIPFFIALYYVLIESVELRQAPFILWIHDLSVKDPFYILPLLMGASMLLQQRLSPAPPDPMQAKVMMAMPILFTVLFLNFPAGLVLYWVVNNSLSILQQSWINSRLKKEGLK